MFPIETKRLRSLSELIRNLQKAADLVVTVPEGTIADDLLIYLYLFGDTEKTHRRSEK